MKYEDSGIREDILAGIREMGFTEMTPIQEQAIPAELAGEDIVGLAQTGTGKTAAFGIPMIQAVDPVEAAVQGVVLCPTRELAMQGAQELEKMGSHVEGLRVQPVYGGADIVRQLRGLEKGAQIVVGTPGRVMDLMRRKALEFSHLRVLVLDEADEMLDMGFREDIETICQAMPEDRRTALFSATMPEEILELTRKYQRDARVIEVSHDELTVSSIRQSFYMVKSRQKDEALCRLIDYMSPKRGLIFCNTKRKVEQLTVMLKRRGYSAEALHGDLVQQQRTRVMELFRTGAASLLLATDVAARGLDIDDVDIVFNYDLPQEMEYYVHRIGRTGRAGKKGKAVSLINTREMRKITALENFCGTRIREKTMPSYADVMPIKANHTMEKVLHFCEDMDLSDYEDLVRAKCAELGDADPVRIAAAFLRESMGEAREDIEILTGRPERRRREGKGKDFRGSRSSRSSRPSGRRFGARKDDEDNEFVTFDRKKVGKKARRQEAERTNDRKRRTAGAKAAGRTAGKTGAKRKNLGERAAGRTGGKAGTKRTLKTGVKSGSRKKEFHGKGAGSKDHYRRRNGRWSGRRENS